MAELARHMGMGRTRFTREFTATVGMPPGAFIRRERLDRGRHHLATTDTRVAAMPPR